MSDKKGFLGGIVFGAVVGAALGLLFAPDSGKETRRKIKDKVEKGKEVAEDSKEKIDDMISRTKDSIERGFEKLNKMVSDKSKPTGREL